MEKTKY
ncbi:Protein of unknown function [Lactobacillus helveticus CIRM-BIA 953]|nr:Protein of unknown function [Lactobacillus helveticus CIRM-BIA 953]